MYSNTWLVLASLIKKIEHNSVQITTSIFAKRNDTDEGTEVTIRPSNRVHGLPLPAGLHISNLSCLYNCEQ
jgi:hypothetical protein